MTAANEPAAPAAPKRRISQKDLRAAVASSGLGSAMPPGGVPAAAPDEPHMVSTIRLTLDQVDPFDANPRTWRNEKYLDIKASIKARHLDTLMWVTKRPGSARYILAKGGGTRYAALRSLWEETKDRKFFEIDFNYCEYRSEADILAGHLSENVNRGDMCFWDKAKGFVDLKDEIRNIFGDLTYDETIAKFNELGMPSISKSLLALYQFAFEKLFALDSSVYGLTMLAVRDVLQPGYNLYLRLAEKAQYVGFDDKIWKPTLERFGVQNGEPVGEKHLDWQKLMAKVDEALAAELDLPVETLRGMLRTLKHDVNSTWEQLLPPSPSAPPAGSPGADEHGDKAPGAGGDLDADEEGDTPPPGPEVSGTGTRVRQTPGTFPRIQPEDGDRPPAALVEQVEAEQRGRAAEAASSTRARAPELAPPGPGAGGYAAGDGTGGSVELNKRALRALAVQLASLSKTLDNMIIQREDLPMGWMVDLPPEVISGTPLPPLAKQIFWFLARASFQIYTGVNQPARIAGTRFADFLMHAAPATEQWGLIQPEGGFDFLMSWLIDPEHAALASPAVRMLTITRDLLANYPDEFLDLGHTLEFQDLQENHQAQRLQLEQDALDYYAQNGASPQMVTRLFPHADLSAVRYRPGRVAEIDLKTAQRLYDVWDDLCMAIASERQRYIRLHRVFSDISMASLYSAINDLG